MHHRVGIICLATGIRADRQVLIDSGMLNDIPEENKIYDRFRDRVMFQLGFGGRTIAFGGRVIDDEAKPKYLNSPKQSYSVKVENCMASSRLVAVSAILVD